MTIITCPQCGRDGSSKGAIPVGTNVRCPACNYKFRYDGPSRVAVPAAIAVADSDPDQDQAILVSDLDFARLEDVLDEPAPQVRTGSPQAPLGPMEVIVVGRGEGERPEEPWFYHGLEFAACINFLASFVLGILAAAKTVDYIDKPERFSDIETSTIIILYGITIGCFSSGMFLKLILDVARNIRAQRYKI